MLISQCRRICSVSTVKSMSSSCNSSCTVVRLEELTVCRTAFFQVCSERGLQARNLGVFFTKETEDVILFSLKKKGGG